MSDVQESVTIPSEMKKLKDSILLLVADIKAKKPVTQISADALPLVIEAISQYSELGEELKDPNLPVFGGLLAGQIIQALK